jgi:hypothetical protein
VRAVEIVNLLLLQANQLCVLMVETTEVRLQRANAIEAPARIVVEDFVESVCTP